MNAFIPAFITALLKFVLRRQAPLREVSFDRDISWAHASLLHRCNSSKLVILRLSVSSERKVCTWIPMACMQQGGVTLRVLNLTFDDAPTNLKNIVKHIGGHCNALNP